MRRIALAGLAMVVASGCTRFQAKPLSAAKNLEVFENRTLHDPQLKGFLETHRMAAEWPLPSWDLMSLTLAAFYFHPDLDEARTALAVARGGIITAAQRPNPTVAVAPQFNSTTPANAPISPWVVTLNFDIPIETAGKRGYRILQARHLTEAARLKIANAAWQVRSRLRGSLLDLHAALETETLLKTQQAIQQDNVRLLKLQLDAGAVSPFEVSQASIGLATTRLALEDASKKKAQTRVQLADSLGLPVKALEGVNLSFETFKQAAPQLPVPEVRRQALLNRADILAGLAEYEASQAALQLEIAKQYPDLHITPGYEYDQSEHKWGLGASLELPVLNRNKGPIAEAEARRSESAARFNTLQAKVIGEIDKALAGHEVSLQKVKTAATLVEDSKKREEATRGMYEAGEIPKLAVATAQLERITNELALLNAKVEAQQSLGLLEDAMQSPADLADWKSKIPQKDLELPKKTGGAKSLLHKLGL